jgi:hypothetical protein
MRIFVQDNLSGVAFSEDGRHAKKITTGIYVIFRGFIRLRRIIF